MLGRMIALLENVAGNVKVVGAPEKYAQFEREMVSDRWPGEGPLGGIITALEDAGRSWVGQGDQRSAEAMLRQAYDLYEELGSAEGTARVRARLRALGTRLCHWTHQDRPAFGWDSLTDTERTITDLVAEGLSNRQVASRVFLSSHTVAFHLRHVFWKLGITSRVQLARMAAEQTPRTSAANI